MKNIIYLINCYGTIKYKVGITNEEKLNKRLKSLQTSSPEELVVITTFKTKYATLIERILHRKYKTKKLNGEWFEFLDNDIKGFINECQKIESNLISLEENPYFNKIIKK